MNKLAYQLLEHADDHFQWYVFAQLKYSFFKNMRQIYKVGITSIGLRDEGALPPGTRSQIFSQEWLYIMRESNAYSQQSEIYAHRDKSSVYLGSHNPQAGLREQQGTHEICTS